VRRVPDPVDRRSIRIEITDDGRSRMETLLPDHYRRVAQVMGNVTADERAQLVATLRKIRDRLHCFNTP
jgi:DNA-binding MarR family transcriptional regulator